jgi:hypothetical protein
MQEGPFLVGEGPFDTRGMRANALNASEMSKADLVARVNLVRFVPQADTEKNIPASRRAS